VYGVKRVAMETGGACGRRNAGNGREFYEKGGEKTRKIFHGVISGKGGRNEAGLESGGQEGYTSPPLHMDMSLHVDTHLHVNTSLHNDTL